MKRLAFLATAHVSLSTAEYREIYNKENLRYRNIGKNLAFKHFKIICPKEKGSTIEEKPVVSLFSIHRIRLLSSAMLMEKRLT